MNTTQNIIPDPDQKIDATLRLLGHAQPAAGLEGRVRTRLNRESARRQAGFLAKVERFFLTQRLALAATAATLAGIAIVMGSVQYSHQRTMPASGLHLSAPNSGLGAASGTHISPQPMVAPEHTRSRSERKANGGRATVLRDAHKPAGVAVPDSTEPQKP